MPVPEKAPFAGPQKLLDYLGRYTHRVALSNNRLISCADGVVRFHYRDRADGDQRKIAELSSDAFLRRFLQHVLPKGFLRIRHYGLLANRRKAELLQLCRTHLGVAKPEPAEPKTTAEWILHLVGIDVTHCPQCGSGTLERTEVPPLRRTCFKTKPVARDTS